MEVSIQTVHSDVLQIKKDLAVIKGILSSDGDLTEWACSALTQAREEPESGYIDLDDL